MLGRLSEWGAAYSCFWGRVVRKSGEALRAPLEHAPQSACGALG